MYCTAHVLVNTIQSAVKKAAFVLPATLPLFTCLQYYPPHVEILYDNIQIYPCLTFYHPPHELSSAP